MIKNIVESGLGQTIVSYNLVNKIYITECITEVR